MMILISVLVLFIGLGFAMADEIVYDKQIVYEQPEVIYEERQVHPDGVPQVIQGPPVVVKSAVTARECPIACPAGWNKWGPFTKNCYLMPSQPLKLGSFWEQFRYCRSKEPTSYPIVINDLVEQALATAVVLQYAPSYALALSNAHLWLGAYVDYTGNWVAADGSQPNQVLMITPKLVGARNGTCMSADPKTFGAWLPRPCKDDTGAVICEMAPRPVCSGRTGGMLPISPAHLEGLRDALKNLKMPSVPIFGQVLGGRQRL